MDTLVLPRPPVAFLLDFDGVILDSAIFKAKAFARVYDAEDPQRLAEVLNYSTLHGGITRRDKFEHFERHVFGRDGDAATVDRLTAAYRDLVYDAVLRSAFIPGAERFLELAHRRIGMHLVSGTPHDELVDIVERRGLTKYFASVQGAPPSKLESFKRIIEAHGYDPARSLAVGDALTEFVAASELGIPFLGIVADGLDNPFPGRIPVVASLENVGPLLGLQRDG